ncbi:MAG: KpsF/GutQ family sugar-phosphate isomerase, partial [Acidobacteria bacterium]|nr:KpsF/GutQ family sugar-phosphate isomerase [Acidobacteriota bacterium]
MAKTEKTRDILDQIAEVLDIEIEAIQSVRNNLTEDFDRAVEMLAECEGQVFVAGIGKSG